MTIDASLDFMSADEVEGEAADDGHVTVISAFGGTQRRPRAQAN
jgi:hypothetical protein